MTIEIRRETFVATGTEPLSYREGTYEVGTVQITVGRQRITAQARRYDDGTVYALGFVGRYRTSNNAWRASLRATDKGTFGSFGRDDRSGRYQKMQGISYDPEAYETAR